MRKIIIYNCDTCDEIELHSVMKVYNKRSWLRWSERQEALKVGATCEKVLW